MNAGVYQGAAAMLGLEQWQERISQNLAAGAAPGFKRDTLSFAGVLAEQTGDAQRVAVPTASGRTDHSQGALRGTGNPNHVALQGPGFFKVEMPDGKVLYTRDGEFSVNHEKRLVNKQGFPVLGDAGPIRLDASAGPPQIDHNGKIEQQGRVIARIALSNFADPTQLHRAPGGFIQRPGRELETVEGATGKLAQGFIEESNVSMIREMVDMITVSRAYETNARLISHYDEHLGKAVQTLGNTR
jgi:flagellar basal-body rod protein FlgF